MLPMSNKTVLQQLLASATAGAAVLTIYLMPESTDHYGIFIAMYAFVIIASFFHVCIDKISEIDKHNIFIMSFVVLIAVPLFVFTSDKDLFANLLLFTAVTRIILMIRTTSRSFNCVYNMPNLYQYFALPKEIIQTKLDKFYLIYIFLFSWLFFCGAIYYRLEITLGFFCVLAMAILTAWHLIKRNCICDIQRVLHWIVFMQFNFAAISVLTDRLSWYFYESVGSSVIGIVFILYTLIQTGKNYRNV